MKALLVGCWIGLAAATAARGATPDLPILGQVPEFSLTEAGGRTVRRADLRGHVWVADFIFTRCGSTCPIMTHGLSEV